MCDQMLTEVNSWLTVSNMSDGATGHGWHPTDAAFGARLAMVRQGMGWNVAEAASACGLPIASWRRWERDNDRPRDYMRVCQAIAAKTDVDLAWLAGITNAHKIAS